jgi:hypothetical protein
MQGARTSVDSARDSCSIKHQRALGKLVNGLGMVVWSARAWVVRNAARALSSNVITAIRNQGLVYR